MCALVHCQSKRASRLLIGFSPNWFSICPLNMLIEVCIRRFSEAAAAAVIWLSVVKPEMQYDLANQSAIGQNGWEIYKQDEMTTKRTLLKWLSERLMLFSGLGTSLSLCDGARETETQCKATLNRLFAKTPCDMWCLASFGWVCATCTGPMNVSVFVAF